MDKDTLNALKSGATTALVTFIGLFVGTLTKFVQGLYGWSSTSGQTPLPKISVLGYGVVAAACGASLGLLWGIFRLAQAKGFLPGTAPQFGQPKS